MAEQEEIRSLLEPADEITCFMGLRTLKGIYSLPVFEKARSVAHRVRPAYTAPTCRRPVLRMSVGSSCGSPQAPSQSKETASTR